MYYLVEFLPNNYIDLLTSSKLPYEYSVVVYDVRRPQSCAASDNFIIVIIKVPQSIPLIMQLTA